ncbi:MAG: hypothetical protein ABI724_11740 [Betaproteobacteria bacterium]
MSIYTARKKPGPEAAPQQNQPGSPKGFPAPEVLETNAPPAPYVSRLRKAIPVEYVLPASQTWLEGLPPQVRPVALAAKYARIVNLLAQQWDDYNACSAYFDELLKGRRGKRAGFPADVHGEIRTLREHFQREHYQQLRQAAGGDLAIV